MHGWGTRTFRPWTQHDRRAHSWRYVSHASQGLSQHDRLSSLSVDFVAHEFSRTTFSTRTADFWRNGSGNNFQWFPVISRRRSVSVLKHDESLIPKTTDEKPKVLWTFEPLNNTQELHFTEQSDHGHTADAFSNEKNRRRKVWFHFDFDAMSCFVIL